MTERAAKCLGVFLLTLAFLGFENYALAQAIAARHAVTAASNDDFRAPAAKGKALPAIYLEATDPPAPEDENGTVMARELARQAFLMTARDSFALATRDGSLRELPPAGVPTESRLRLSLAFRKGQETRLGLERGVGDARKVLWTGKAPSLKEGDDDILPWLVEVEGLAHSRFEEPLKKAGFDIRPLPANPGAVVPAEIEKLLGQMNFISQFMAVRALHAEMHSKGESSRLVGALARGYAHLGVVSECLWGPTHKVYKARALLYAQRLVRGDPQSPWGLWHRAYAAALTGLHQAALDDLAEAARLGQKRGSKDSSATSANAVPGWVELVDAVCRFDSAKLHESSKQAGQEQLALLLWFRSLESKSAVQLTLQAAQEVLKANPECFRVYDSIASVGGVSALHRTTLAGMEAFAQVFPGRLKALPDLPDAVIKHLDQKDAEPQLLNSLVEAGQTVENRYEPSWTALGRWAQETRFLQACLRLVFMRDKWTVPVDDFLPQARAMAAGHPCAKLIDCFALDIQRQAVEIARLLADVPLTDLDFRAETLFTTHYRVNRQRYQQIGRIALLNLDSCHEDYALLFSGWVTGNNRKGPAESLLKISPYAPLARAILIELNWNLAKPRAVAWEKESQRPEVFLALGQRYAQLQQTEDAERCFKRCLSLSPDLRSYRLLANVYKQQGRNEQWLATLEEVLKHEDTGLNHAEIQVEIARHFMAKKDFKRAQPYADAAAQTWAEWAMICASDCHEGLGHWEQAESWAQRVSERYAPQATSFWFFWCKRTGKGNAQAAQQLVAEQIERMGPDRNLNDHLTRAAYFALVGEPRKAAEALQPVIQSGKAPVSDVLAALLRDEAAETRQRDELLKDIDRKNPFKPLADFFLACLSKGEKADIDLVQVDKVIKSLNANEQPTGCYLVGRFLELRGQTKAAQEYYKRRLADETQLRALTAVLAGSRLQEMVSK